MTVRAPFVNVSGDTMEMPSGDSLPVSSFGAMGGAVIAPTALSGNTNDWAPTSAAVSAFWQISASAIYNLTGIAAPTTTGTILTLENTGAYPIALTHQDTSSASGNRFNTPTGQTTYLAPGATIRAFHDGTYWQILSNSSMTANEALEYFGDGSDGTATITTATQAAGTWLVSGALVRDAYLTTLTINSLGAIKLNGFRLFCRVLDISAAATGAITANGPSGSNATVSAGGVTGGSAPQITSPVSSTPTGGITGTTAAGAQAAGASIGTVQLGGSCGTTGASGAGVNAGAAQRTAPTANNAKIRWRILLQSLFPGGSTSVNAGMGSAGGASGGGDNSSKIGGSGGGGAAAGCTAQVHARFILRGTNTNAGIIQAMGGNGGNGAAGASGGGATGGGSGAAGAGGGVIYVVCESLLGSPITNALDVSGGAAGTAGTGTSGGATASASGAGFGGVATVFVIATMTITVTDATTSTGSQRATL